MKPTAAVALLCLLPVPNLTAQAALTAGQRVRITSQKHQFDRKSADVISVTGDELVVHIRRARESRNRAVFTIDTVTLMRSSIDRLEVSAADGPATGRGAAIGFGVGALVGGTIGYALGSSNCHNCYVTPADAAAIGVGVLGVVGAIAGAVVGSQRRWHRWEEVPAARGGVVPLWERNLGIGVVIRF